MAAMLISDVKIVALRAKVVAASEEVDKAIQFHEVWKPAAYDAALHERMGRSYSTNTFLIIRQALRLEMLLALTRLWDRDAKAVGMSGIANTLCNGRVVDALAAECEEYYANTPLLNCDPDYPEDLRQEIEQFHRANELQFGREQSKLLRDRAAEAVGVIRSYAKGEPNYATLNALLDLRNQQMAHRQVNASVAGFDATNADIEAFYQQMLNLIRLLRGAVENVDYRPEETARIRRRHAELFWADVRGERTLGHPDYVEPHVWPLR